jgi:hypothetical protein
VFSPRSLDLGGCNAESFGVGRDQSGVGNVCAVDEERSRHRVMKTRRSVVAAAGAYEFHRFERATRIRIAPGRVDRYPDLASKSDEPLADCRPFGIGEGLIGALDRSVGMEFERQPAGAYTQVPRSLLDPDRAEIAERSNDV